MRSLFKTQAVFVPGMSKVHKGLYSFLVHPDDQIVFKAKMAQLLKDQFGNKRYIKTHPNLILSVSIYHPAKTRKQENMYRKIIREICIQEQSEAYGSDPDNVHSGVVARAALSFGFPTVIVGGLRIPISTKNASTKDLNLLMEVSRVIAGEMGADVSHIGAEE